MKISEMPSRAELLHTLQTLKAEQRRIDHAIAAVEVILRGESGSERGEHPAAVEFVSGNNKNSKAIRGGEEPGMLLSFPRLARPELA